MFSQKQIYQVLLVVVALYAVYYFFIKPEEFRFRNCCGCKGNGCGKCARKCMPRRRCCGCTGRGCGRCSRKC